MDLKAIITSFREKHSKEGESINLTLLPSLFQELIKHGFNVSMANGDFYQKIASELYKEQTREMQIDTIDAILLLSHLVPIPKKVEPLPVVVKKETTPAVMTEFSLDSIPNEEDEGDPLHTPPEDRLYLRPEDFAPMQYDEEYCAKIGATKDRR